MLLLFSIHNVVHNEPSRTALLSPPRGGEQSVRDLVAPPDPLLGSVLLCLAHLLCTSSTDSDGQEGDWRVCR